MKSSDALAGAEPSLLTIPVICGPTASGKSAIAMWLSLRREILVISADSRQVYRGFDIGTAKPTADERARVPHRGIDVVDPADRFSAADFAALAHAAIGEALAQSRIPIIVGGTGFYIGAVFRPLWAEPPHDADRRRALQAQLDTLTTEELRRWCERLDPARARLGRAQLLRAVEIALLTGERLSELHASHARPRTYAPSYLLVDPGTELAGRIAARASAMFDAGWPDEVRRLMETVPLEAPAWKATGYEAVRSYVHGGNGSGGNGGSGGGGLDRAATLERVVIETRQYAKRQRTWFRHQLAPDPVLRLAPQQAGWQEKVDRWITEVEEAMRQPGRPK